jgi:ribose 5-phosphate isomerase B
MKVFIGADHRGYQLKNNLYKWLRTKGYDAVDCGPHELKADDDYPDFALSVGEGVARHEGSRGVLMCGSGVGMDIVANKVRGVRATLGLNADTVVHGRARDDINVLVMSADLLDAPAAESLMELFLMTPFGAAERDLRRQRKIADIEAQNFK